MMYVKGNHLQYGLLQQMAQNNQREHQPEKTN